MTIKSIKDAADEIRRLACYFDKNGELSLDCTRSLVAQLGALIAYTPEAKWQEILKERGTNEDARLVYSTLIVNPFVGTTYVGEHIVGAYAYIWSQPASVDNMREPLQYVFRKYGLVEQPEPKAPFQSVFQKYFGDVMEVADKVAAQH